MDNTHRSSVPPSKAGGGDHDDTGTFPGMKQPRWKVRQASMVRGNPAPPLFLLLGAKQESAPAVQLHDSRALGPFLLSFFI